MYNGPIETVGGWMLVAGQPTTAMDKLSTNNQRLTKGGW